MISNRCHYALCAVLELAKREGSGTATIQEIAQSQDIPARFLEAILRDLKQAGLTSSVRGKLGGYRLARPAKEVTMYAVIRAIEGPTLLRKQDKTNIFKDVWKEAEAALATVYQAADFAALAEMSRRSAPFVPDYAI